LADHQLLDAAMSVREQGSRTGDVRSLFHLDYARSLPFGARSAITKCLPNSAHPSLTSA
jgi:hypothetical protein